MRMTFHTDYALRMLIYLALSSDGRATVGQIAKAYDLSRHHLLKVAQTLRAQGLIETIRGRTGGIRLASSPAQINVGTVVRAVEEEMVVVECMGSGRCQISLQKPLVPLWTFSIATVWLMSSGTGAT